MELNKTIKKKKEKRGKKKTLLNVENTLWLSEGKKGGDGKIDEH